LAGVKATPASDGEAYPGYPLQTRAPLAWLLLFVLWPVIIVTFFWRIRRG
jgi:hypothetical protein